MISDTLFKRYYPDDRINGTKEFYDWIRIHLSKNDILLNLGAGPASFEKIARLKGEVNKVIGADMDPVVIKNPDLDEGHLIIDNKLSFDDNYFNVIVSDYVLEHVREPDIFFKELHRVLKPGGYFFFRTPNKNHYVTIISKLTPHKFHQLIANKVRGLPKGAPKPYKTYYYLNDPKTLTEYSKKNNFKGIELRFCEAQPSYLVFNSFFFLMGVAYERIVNRFNLKFLKSNIFGKMVK